MSFNADIHQTTSMRMHENALYYLTMHVHVCGDNAAHWLRLSENHSYSWRGVGHALLMYRRRHP